MKKIRVIELFAGVGGFRVGLNRQGNEKIYDIVWSNQWEPGTKTQHASQIYTYTFGSKNHSCEDIQSVIENNFKQIPDHDLLVGGFPCQDYSVARTLNQSAGIYGKKGVLWWSIFNILNLKGNNSPNYLLLENVDRLLKSPSSQRGRDFAIMLTSLADLGYIVEWRVLNAADYGFPQRRRRVFILGYKKGSVIYKQIKQSRAGICEWIYKTGVIAKAFPVRFSEPAMANFKLTGKLEDVSINFSSNKPTKSPFEISGLMIGRDIYTAKTFPKFTGKQTTLEDILVKDESEIPDEFFIDNKALHKWRYLKGAKKERRKSKNGFEYNYSEGGMVFPDSLENPSRTIVTGEGGSAPSRFKHVITTQSGRLRRLTPLELERLNLFPDNHTKYMGHNKITPDVKRAYLMGNALVVGVIERFGIALSKFITEDSY